MARPASPAADAAPVTQHVLVPAVAAFDFLEGGFARSENSRLVGLVCAGLSLVTLAGTLVFGGLASVNKMMVSDELTAAQGELARVSAEQATLDQAEGIPTSTIEAHIKSQGAAIRSAVGGELDTVRILEDIWSSAPSGVSITGVTFAAPGAAADAKDGAATPKAGITVTATANAFALLAAWSQALGQVTGLSDVDVTWSGGGENVSVTVTANLTDLALSSRAAYAGSPASSPVVPAGDLADPAALPGSMNGGN